MKNYKIIKNVKNILFYVFLIVLIILLINNLSGKSEKLYNIVKFRSYTILSGSMEPKIKPGDLVIVKKVNPSNLKSGDVITFNKIDENIVVTHRIQEKNEDGFITKGDNNNVVDTGIFKESDIIGKVVATIPKIGYVPLFFAKPMVISVILILLALSIAWDVFKKEN